MVQPTEIARKLLTTLVHIAFAACSDRGGERKGRKEDGKEKEKEKKTEEEICALWQYARKDPTNFALKNEQTR